MTVRRLSPAVLAAVVVAAMLAVPQTAEAASADNRRAFVTVNKNTRSQTVELNVTFQRSEAARVVPSDGPEVSSEARTEGRSQFVASLRRGERAEYLVTVVDAAGRVTDEARVLVVGEPRADGEFNLGPLSYAVGYRWARLSWKPLPDVDGYIVYRNGRNVGATDTAGFTDEELEPGSEYEYTVVATGPKPDNEDYPLEYYGRDHVASDLAEQSGQVEFTLSTTLTTLSAADRVQPDGQTIGQVTLASTNTQLVASLPSSTTIRHTTFIPEKYVGANIWCGGTSFVNRAFGGDNRGFSATSSRRRTRAEAYMRWGGSTSLRKAVGTTRFYRKNSDGSKTLIGTRTASTSGITMDRWHRTSRKREFYIRHAVGNPYCPGGYPKIDGWYKGTVWRGNGNSGYYLHGKHDRAPNHEIYYTDSSTSSWYGVRKWKRGAFACLATAACTRTYYSVDR